MRVLLVAIIWIVVLGGLQAFVSVRHEPARQAGETVFEEAEGEFALEISATFDGEDDPFALNIGDQEPVAMRVLLLGREVYASSDFSAHLPFIVEGVGGLIEGENEFFVTASPPVEAHDQAHAVRLRVLRDGLVLDEYTLWGEPGERIGGSITLVLEDGDGHEH